MSGLPEPPNRQKFKTTLRGLAPDPTTGSKNQIPGGKGLRKMGNRAGTLVGRSYLAQESDINSRLNFHFNPSEYNDAESASWGSDSVANRPRPKYTYKHGGARTLTFTLLLDEVRMGPPYELVFNALKWLRMRMNGTIGAVHSWTREKGTSKKKKSKADILFLVRENREVFRCHIKDMKVREDMFAPNSSYPVRAWVDLTLEQNLEDDELESSTGV